MTQSMSSTGLATGSIRAAIVGGTGYSGAELMRLLLQHPRVRVDFVASPSGAGRPLSDHHPALRNMTQLPLSPMPANDAAWPEVDCIFLCLPHGVSRDLVPLLPRGPRVIDLSGDFRLRDGEIFAKYYGTHPPSDDWQKQFVYGQPEIGVRQTIAKARYIANPGCFATAVILALAPLVKERLIESRVIVDAKTGSSGAGAKPSSSTQHATRANSFFGYKSFAHQHTPEINQALASLASDWPGHLVLQAHSTPLVRGIFATVYCRMHEGVSDALVGKAFTAMYGESPFIRLVEGSPNVNWSRGSNFVDVGWCHDGRELIVFAALDNLGKGAAGQAVQNMNLLFGLDETMGLWQAGGVP